MVMCMQPSVAVSQQSWWNLSRYMPSSLGQWWQTSSVKNIPWYLYGMAPELSARQKWLLGGALGGAALAKYLYYHYVTKPMLLKEQAEKKQQKLKRGLAAYELEFKVRQQKRYDMFKNSIKKIPAFISFTI